MDQYLGLNIRI
jgi:hypothetical protein